MAALKDSSISITDTDREGKTPLDRLCQWIADKGHKDFYENGHRGDARLDCFEVLVAHDDARDERLQLGVTWTAVLLRGLAGQAGYLDDPTYIHYPPETTCSRAIYIAIDKGVLLDDLGSELDHDSIFDIAVRLRQESLILKLLDNNASIDFDKPSRKEPHYTPLQSLCAYCCPVSLIQVAIQRTRDVCGSDIQGLGPLHLLFLHPKAQHENMAPSIRALLDARVEINEAKNDTGRTALMMAAASEISSDAVGALLSSGAKFDLRDANAWNALLFACESGTESAIRLLIDAGSTILYKPMEVEKIYVAAKPVCGPIQLAAARGMSNIVKLLLESERSVGNSDNNEVPTSPLLMACVGNQKTVRLLMGYGYDPKFWDTSLGLSPLHVASWAGETRIVRVLLEAGCDKEASDASGLKAWMLAIMKGDTRTADMLNSFTGEHISQAVSPIRLLQSAEHQNLGSATTKNSADKSAVPDHSRSPTSYAVHRPRFGRVVVRHSIPVGMRQFFTKGCVLNIMRFVKGGINMKGRFKDCTCTPMLIAVWQDALDVVEYLVSIGVPLFTEDQCSLHARKGYTVPELLASDPIWTQPLKRWFCRLDWRAQLSQNGLFSMIASAIEDGNPETLGVLLDKVASPFPSCKIVGWDILPGEFLHQAAKRSGTSATSCATMLLSHGLDVDCLDRYRRTPLQTAIWNGKPETVKLLLSYNAALNVVTKDDMTALSMAAQEGDVSIINHLLASGAYPGFCSAPTLSPVSVAAESGEYVAFRALLNAGGTAQTQDYYALCESGSRSVLMLDERYFGAMQGPDLLHSLHYDCGKWVMPFLKAMPLARRALHFATLHPKKKTTALYGAARECDVSFLDIALRCGAAINMEGGPEGTPLMAACIAGHTSIVKRLVQCGALLT
jgi:ankyrin repeat protein